MCPSPVLMLTLHPSPSPCEIFVGVYFCWCFFFFLPTIQCFASFKGFQTKVSLDSVRFQGLPRPRAPIPLSLCLENKVILVPLQPVLDSATAVFKQGGDG